MLVLAAFGGTAFAAMRMMDAGPSAEALREARAKQEPAQARKQRRAGKRSGGKKPLAAAATPVPDKSRARRRWAARADDLCDDAYDEAMDVVATSVESGPQEVLRVFGEALRINSRFIARMKRLGPAPNRRAHAQLMQELQSGQAEDSRNLRRLKARWKLRSFEQMLQDSMRRNRSLRRLALRLGAVSCAELFDDPMTVG
jgi:hypothetical protein